MYDLALILLVIFGGQALGSTLGLIRRPSEHLLHSSLAFAGAMMIGISFIELIPLSAALTSIETVVIFFIAGLLVFEVADHVIPHIHPELLKKEQKSVKKSVNMLLIGISLHNIPEGLAVGIGFAVNPAMGMVIALGISIQDIPENLATIVPLYCLNKCRSRSFLIVMGTVLFELLGFLIGYFFLNGASLAVVGIALAVAAGLMTYISLDELLPSAQIKERPIAGIISILLGIATVIVLSLLTGAPLPK